MQCETRGPRVQLPDNLSVKGQLHGGVHRPCLCVRVLSTSNRHGAVGLGGSYLKVPETCGGLRMLVPAAGQSEHPRPATGGIFPETGEVWEYAQRAPSAL